MKDKKPVWMSYEQATVEQEYLKMREPLVFLIHPWKTPPDVKKEIMDDFDRRWERRLAELKLEFKEMEEKGLINKEDGK